MLRDDTKEAKGIRPAADRMGWDGVGWDGIECDMIWWCTVATTAAKEES